VILLKSIREEIMNLPEVANSSNDQDADVAQFVAALDVAIRDEFQLADTTPLTPDEKTAFDRRCRAFVAQLRHGEFFPK
jgi:hypothetical protein